MAKKGQEEIVGFVIIIVIVAIALLILFGIMIRQDRTEIHKDSREVNEFIESAYQYTTECSLTFEPDYGSVSDLVGACYKGGSCTSGESPCKVANDTIYELIKSAWTFGEDKPLKGFVLNVTNQASQRSNSTTISGLIYIYEGNCSGSRRGAEDIRASSSGSIISSLTLCS